MGVIRTMSTYPVGYGGGGYPGYGSPYPPPANNNVYYAGSPLDFAQNYLNPQMADINNQINSFIGTLPPPQAGQPGAASYAAAPQEGGGPNLGGAVSGIVGGAAVGAAIGTFIPIPGIGTASGAVIGGIIGGIAGLFS